MTEILTPQPAPAREDCRRPGACQGYAHNSECSLICGGLVPAPTAHGWLVYLPSEQRQEFYESQEDAGYIDDVTNHEDAVVTPYYRHPVKGPKPTREDARRYCAAGFQAWLDDYVADGVTIYDVLTSVHDAYSGFQAAGSYTPCSKGPLTDEQIDLIAADGMRSAAGGIYATSVHRFARECIAAATQELQAHIASLSREAWEWSKALEAVTSRQRPLNVIALPPLPQPDTRERVYVGHGNEKVVEYFSATMMRDYARGAVHEAEDAWQARAAAKSDAQAQATAPASPVGYLSGCELERVMAGHQGTIRSARFGPSELDGDVPVYTRLETIAARAAEPDLCQYCGGKPHPGCNSEFSAEKACRFWGPGVEP